MKSKNIILVRHGESEGNVDKNIYSIKPDYALNLTNRGKEQATMLGKNLCTRFPGKFAVYYSPFFRTIETLNCLASQFPAGHFDKHWVREEPRIREQEWTGGLRKDGFSQDLEDERDAFGHFYYRFHSGESCADVYDRNSDFLSTLYRDFEKVNFPENCLIVSHGMTMRVLIMKWFHKTVEEFERYANPKNCEYWVLKLDSVTGKYDLQTSLRLHEIKHDYKCKLEIP